jgi:2-haloacid dehalogenase/putative hydrolase of the HAD superfamily
MAIKALMVDFFGTLVKEEDGLVIGLCRSVMDTSPAVFNIGEVARYWWEVSHERYMSYHGKDFVGLKELEMEAFAETVEHFNAKVSPREALLPIFRNRLTPQLFDDSRVFISRLPLPSVIVTNGDRSDIERALQATQLTVSNLITSEDVASYKPRKEIFEQALKSLGVAADEVLVVGDSLQYDIVPAQELGMHTAWVNRSRRAFTGGQAPDIQVANLTQLRTLMLGN